MIGHRWQTAIDTELHTIGPQGGQDRTVGPRPSHAQAVGRRRLLMVAAVAGVLAVAAVASGVARACVPIPQALAVVHPRASGPPGMEVTLNGLGYDEGPVEIRWNALDGPRLASATGPDFAVLATVPEAPDGLYSIVVLSRSDDGSIGTAGSAPFEVRSTPRPQAASEASGDPSATRATPAPADDSAVPELLTGGLLVAVSAAVGALAGRRWRGSSAGRGD